MKRIGRVAIISTTLSVLALLFISNTALALRPVAPNGVRPPCIPVLDVPFTNYSFELPLWMWSFQFYVFALSTVAAMICWTVMLFKWAARNLGSSGRGGGPHALPATSTVESSRGAANPEESRPVGTDRPL